MFRVIIDLERQFRSFQGFRSTTSLSILRHSVLNLQWSQLTKHHNFIVFWGLDEPHVCLCKELSSCSCSRYCSCRCSYSSCVWCWLRAGTGDRWSLARVYSSSQAGARTFREETEDGNPGPGGFRPSAGFVTGVWAAVWNSIELLLLTSHSPWLYNIISNIVMWNFGRNFGRYPSWS